MVGGGKNLQKIKRLLKMRMVVSEYDIQIR